MTSLRLWKARGDDRGGGVDVGGSVGLELGGRKKGLNRKRNVIRVPTATELQ